MNKFLSTERSSEIKFAPSNPSLLGILSNRDIQIFQTEAPSSGTMVSSDFSSVISTMKLKQVVEIGQLTTFEWQRHFPKTGLLNQYILAASTNGKVSLVNAQLGAHEARVEKVFINSGMVQNQRHCNALAWNPINPRLFAAGYDHAQNESSLMIWDIERSMNQYLNRARIEEEGEDGFSEDHQPHLIGRTQQRHSPKIITEYHQAFQNISDDIYSIAWLPDSEYELIYSTENQIQFCDKRQSYNQKTIIAQETQNKQFFKLRFDPFHKRRFAALAEDQILIFDLRATNQVQFQIKNDRGIRQEAEHLLEGGGRRFEEIEALPSRSSVFQKEDILDVKEPFSGFNWCLNRENQIVTYTKGSSIVKFWDLTEPSEAPQLQEKEEEAEPQQSTNQKGNFPQVVGTTVLRKPHSSVDCQQRVMSMAWKPKNQHNFTDKNRFVIHTPQGAIHELTYFERNFSVVDLSPKGEICFSVQNPKFLQNPKLNAAMDLPHLMNAAKKYNLQTIGIGESRMSLEHINYEAMLNKRKAPDPSTYSEDKDQIGMMRDPGTYMLHRLKAGYEIDNPKHNLQLASRFVGAEHLYSAKGKSTHGFRKAGHTRGIKSFWQWITYFQGVASEQSKKEETESQQATLQTALRQFGLQQAQPAQPVQVAENNFEFLGEGIFGVITKEVKQKHAEWQLPSMEKTFYRFDLENDSLLGIKYYNSKMRQRVIEACGWSEVIPPTFRAEKLKLSNEGKLEKLQKCYSQLFESEGMARPGTNDDSTTEDKSLSKVRGIYSRAAIMACLHFDFSQACHYIEGTAQKSKKEAYQESDINRQILLNICLNLREIQRKPAVALLQAFREQSGSTATYTPTNASTQNVENLVNQKFSIIREMNKDLGDQMTNPYFQLFFNLLDPNKQDEWLGSSDCLALDIFDLIAILFRFSDLKTLIRQMKEIIKEGVRKGSLTVLPLLGLNSPLVLELLKNFVDSTSDLQTAAYVAAYAINVQAISGACSDRKENKLAHFVQAYRAYLNGLQLWNTRAAFDVKLGDLLKSSKDNEKEASDKIMQPQILEQYAACARKQTGLKSTNQKQGAADGSGKYDKIKQFADMNGNDIYAKRAFENHNKCYFCGCSYSLEKQLEKLTGSASGGAQNQRQAMMRKIQGGIPGQSDKRNDELQNKKYIHQCFDQKCQKKVPHCSVCLLPMDMLNPYAELKKMQQQPGGKMPNFPGMGGGMGLNMGKPAMPDMGHMGGFGMGVSGMGGGQPMGMGSGMMGGGLGGLSMLDQSAGPGMASPSQGIGEQNPNTKISQHHSALGSWMTWCQTCHHGGHANHMTEWFAKNHVCPVSDCQCECSSL